MNGLEPRPDPRAGGQPSPADDRRRRARSSPWPTRLFGAGVRRRRDDRPARGRAREPRPAERSRRPGLAGRLPRRLRARRGGDRGRPPGGALARRGLVDWPAVERVAIGRLRHAPGRLSAAELTRHRGRLRRGDGPHRAPPERGARDGPARGRRAGGRRRSGRLGAGELGQLRRRSSGGSRATLLDQILPPGGGIGQASMALANRWISTRQLGFMLGFMATRVLGQYDLALLSRRGDAGSAPVRRGEHPPDGAVAGRAARRVPDLDRPPRDDPRVRVRGAPVAPAVPRRAARTPARRVQREAQGPAAGRRSGASAERSAARPAGEHWMERLMGDEQRRLFRETQAVMSLLEGFSDYIMDEVGRDLVPDVERISERFHERRERASRLRARDPAPDRHGPQARAVQEGRAVRRRDRRGGRAGGARRLWDGPESLPPAGEIAAPERWIARVAGGLRA